MSLMHNVYNESKQSFACVTQVIYIYIYIIVNLNNFSLFVRSLLYMYI